MIETSQKQTLRRPDVFAYHDYRSFLRDWFAYLRISEPGFSMRALAKEAGLAAGYLPMVLSGARTLSPRAGAKVLPHLSLTASERSYFHALHELTEAESEATRLQAFEKIQRFRSYRTNNPKETETYRYLTRWFYVAIREMAALDGFQTDPEWIQNHLRVKVPLHEIKQALQFLSEHGYLAIAKGKVGGEQKEITCVGEVYRLALSKFHREMLHLASESIENTPREERLLLGHTLAIPATQYAAVKSILEEALNKVAALGRSSKPHDTVYHVILSTFPLTVRGKSPQHDDH